MEGRDTAFSILAFAARLGERFAEGLFAFGAFLAFARFVFLVFFRFAMGALCATESRSASAPADGHSSAPVTRERVFELAILFPSAKTVSPSPRPYLSPVLSQTIVRTRPW